MHITLGLHGSLEKVCQISKYTKWFLFYSHKAQEWYVTLIVLTGSNKYIKASDNLKTTNQFKKPSHCVNLYLFLCSLMQGSMFLPFLTTSIKTTPVPRWKSTLRGWLLVMGSAIQKWCVSHIVAVWELPLKHHLLIFHLKYNYFPFFLFHFRCLVAMVSSCTKQEW